jgi:hypothetical protein
MPKKLTRKQEHAKLLREHRKFYEPLLELQGGVCAICGRPPSSKRRLDMDHDHRTMVVRGLLCVPCNRQLRTWVTREWLAHASEYLRAPPFQRLTKES